MDKSKESNFYEDIAENPHLLNFVAVNNNRLLISNLDVWQYGHNNPSPNVRKFLATAEKDKKEKMRKKGWWEK